MKVVSPAAMIRCVMVMCGFIRAWNQEKAGPGPAVLKEWGDAIR